MEVTRAMTTLEKTTDASGVALTAGLGSEPECCREWKQAMYLLAGLHPCLTVEDTDPMGQAQAIFDSVLAERRALAEDRDHARRLVEWLHGELRKRPNA